MADTTVTPTTTRLPLTRVVATEAALAATDFPDDLVVFTLAADERLVLGDSPFVVPDPHAIVVPDAGWSGRWMATAEAEPVLAAHCGFEIPADRPTFVQGMVAGLAVKLWMEPDRTLFLVPHVFAAEFDERIAS